MQKIALLSVYSKQGIVEFAKDLVALRFKILASGGTAKELSAAGIEVTDVANLVGGGAILGHRVLTLSREIHAGLLARDTDEDRAELKRLGILWIDLVCVDLYPLSEEIGKWNQETLTRPPGADTLSQREREIMVAAKAAVLEKTDMGGPALLRSAAKGRRIVVCDADDRSRVIDWIKNGRKDREQFITSLAAKAEFIVADYCLQSARYHSSGKFDGMIGQQIAECKYGENGYQTPAGLYAGVGDGLKPSPTGDELSLSNFKVIAGTAPSYNNWADVDRLLQTMTHIAAGLDVNFPLFTPPSNLPPPATPISPSDKWGTPAGGGREQGDIAVGSPPLRGGARGGWLIAVGVKHGNPCGAAVSDEPSEAIKKMLEGDLRAVFGGVVMVNFEIDQKLAEVLLIHKMENNQRRLLDGIIAPKFSPAAIEMLKRKGDKCRFLVNSALSNLSKNSLDDHRRFRYVRGGFLVQPNYNFILDVVSPFMGSQPTADKSTFAEATADRSVNYTVIGELSDQQKSDLLLGWAIGGTSNSNTITIVKDGQLLGNGVGQQDRVSCCQLAIKRATDANHNIEGAVAYSDSFFPFVDGVQTLADAGITAIFATSGSVRDGDIKKFCADNNISLVMLPDAEARGFFGH